MSDTPTILVVDDDDDLRAIVEFRLKRDGYTVLTAADGDAALELARGDQRPDVCVLDVMMPRRSGHEVLRELRADEATRDIRVIMLTARAQERDITEGFSLGADDYLTKPFSPGELATRVKAQLARSGA